MRAFLLLLPLALALAASGPGYPASGEVTQAASGARGPVGIGFVTVGGEAVVSVADSVALRFYASPEATRAEHEITVYLAGDVYTAQAPAWLRPDVWWPDYYLFNFRALETQGDWARVVVHEESARTLWVRTGGAVGFVPWDTFLTQHVTIVQRTDISANPVRTAPEAGAPLADVAPEATRADWGGDCLLPTEVRGEWARVTLSELCGIRVDAPPLGWIRWRDGDRLLITWGLTC